MIRRLSDQEMTKRLLLKRSVTRQIFRKYSIPSSEITYRLVQEFENSLMGPSIQFRWIDRDQLKATQNILKKIAAQAEKLPEGTVKSQITQLITPIIRFKLPKTNQDLASVIERTAPLANHLLTKHQSIFLDRRETLLYPLLADLINTMWPGIIRFTDSGLHESEIRAFKKHLKGKLQR